MENMAASPTRLIADSYQNYHRSVYLYIYYRINDKEEAEDLSQDVFLRLMDYKQILCSDTIKHFIYTIAHNLVTDYLRRYYKRQEITSYLYDTLPKCVYEVEEKLAANDILKCERHRINRLPPQRQKIYIMNRFEEKTAAAISKELNLSCRTVENHLYISRNEVRKYIKQCI